MSNLTVWHEQPTDQSKLEKPVSHQSQLPKPRSLSDVEKNKQLAQTALIQLLQTVCLQYAGYERNSEKINSQIDSRVTYPKPHVY